MLTYLMKSEHVAERFDEEVVDFLVKFGYAEHYRTLTISGAKVHYYRPKGD